MLEALFALLDDPKAISVQHVGESGKDIVVVNFENGFVATVHLFMDIAATFQITLFGQNEWRQIDIKNSYSMFKENLTEFVKSLKEGKSRIPFEKTENIILMGPSGVGKSHLAIAIGIEACKKRIRNIFYTVPDLIKELKIAKISNNLPDFLDKLSRYPLIIIDELSQNCKSFIFPYFDRGRGDINYPPPCKEQKNTQTYFR